MNRTRTFAFAATLALVLAGGTARAVLDTAAFSGIQSLLEFHRDNDFGGTLDAALRKRKAAVTKGLALLAKPSTTYAKDAATAIQVLKLVLKAYPDDFVPVGKTADFGTLFEQLTTNLTGTLQTQTGTLAGRIGGLGTGPAKSVQKQVDRAQSALTAATSGGLSLQARLGKLVAAAKAIAAGTKIADKAIGGGGAGLRATVNGTALAATSASAEFYTGDNTLQIYGSFTLPGNVRDAVYLLVKGVTGPGTYPITTAASARGNYQHVITSPLSSTIYDLVPNVGSVTVQILQTGATKRVKATFSYDATHMTEGTKMITAGSIDVSGNSDVSVYTTSGFEN